MSSGSKSVNSSVAALLSEGARILSDDEDSFMEQSLPEAGKTPTTPVQGTDLAAVVDGGNGVERIYSTSSQGRHVSSINTGNGPGSRSRWGQWGRAYVQYVQPGTTRILY